LARKLKQVITSSGTDRRATGYYATPLLVAEYFYQRCVAINPEGHMVFDPCVGQEELLTPFIAANTKQAERFKLQSTDVLRHLSVYQSHFLQGDFLLTPKAQQTKASECDFIVANPPYNCHEVDYIKQHKADLKHKFKDVGVHNMYSMFLAAMIDKAADGCVIATICDSSFLTAKVHSKLRKKILSSCIIHDLILCPTDLFLDQGANVRTCILVLQKGRNLQQPRVRLLNRPLNQADFFAALAEECFIYKALTDIVLNSDVDNMELLVGVPCEIKALFDGPRLSAKFACISGVSTGNDHAFIRKQPEAGFSVPFYKNPSSSKFFCAPNGFLIDDFLHQSQCDANFNVRNQQYLMQSGITCSSMGIEFSACLLPQGSLFGVNPNIICDEQSSWWLVAYLNSDLVKYCVRGVLIRTNMITSGYVARLPLPDFTVLAKQQLAQLAKQAYQGARQQQDLAAPLASINQLVNKELKFSEQTIADIALFCRQIVKRT
jgi:hypothetical protein